LLDENQRRALAGYLYELETKLGEIKRDLTCDSDDVAPVIFSLEQDVGDGARRAILDATTTILEELRQVKESYELLPNPESSKRRLYGMLLEIRTTSMTWARRLPGFSGLTPGDAAVLHSFVSRVNTVIDSMYRSL